MGKAKGVRFPLPEFSTRFEGKLESILGSISLKGFLLQKNILEIAVSYFVTLVKSQAFIDGNKRMAIIFTATFLNINGYRLIIPQTTLGRIALAIAIDKTTSIRELEKIILPIFRKHIFQSSDK